MKAVATIEPQNWARNMAVLVQKQGYRVTPVFSDGTTMPFAKGQTYGPRSSKYDDAKHVGVIMDGVVLLDYDDNKGEPMPLDELAALLGLDEMPEPNQVGPDGKSLHWLFRMPEGEEGLKQSNDGAWPDIDIKTGNQLMHLKPKKKLHSLPRPEDMALAPPALVDKLRKADTGTSDSDPGVKLTFKQAVAQISTGDNLHGCVKAIIHSLVFKGYADEGIMGFFGKYAEKVIEARGAERWAKAVNDDIPSYLKWWRSKRDRGIVERYWFIDSLNKWFDTTTHQTLAHMAVNVAQGHQYVGPPIEGAPTSAVSELAMATNKVIVNGVGWHPVDDTPQFIHDGKTLANTWRGLAIAPVPGEPTLWLELMAYIYGEYADLVIDHMAFSIQHPAQKIRWQVMTYGEPRTGKTATTRPLERIWGGGSRLIDGEALKAGWGDTFYQTKVIVVEEVMAEGKASFFNQLKTKLANDGVESLNIKGGGVVYQQNLYSVYMFSNEVGALTFARNEDKLLVIKAPDEACWDDFAPYFDAVDSGDLANQVLGFLQRRDVSKFSAGRLPIRTAALDEMVREGASDTAIIIGTGMEAGEGPFEGDWDYVTVKDVIEWLRSQSEVEKVPGVKAVGSALRSLSLHEVRGQRKGEKATPRLWVRWEDELRTMRPREVWDWWHDSEPAE